MKDKSDLLVLTNTVIVKGVLMLDCVDVWRPSYSTTALKRNCTVHPANDTIYVFVLNSPLPDNMAWRVCTQRSAAAWWLHERCTPSLPWSSSSCSATGRWGALPTLPFPAAPPPLPPPPPGSIQGALRGDKLKPHNLVITYLSDPDVESCHTKCKSPLPGG